MAIERIILKVSGDLIQREDVLDEIKNLAKQNSSRIDLIYGFGTSLSRELDKRGIYYKFVNGIRETNEDGLDIGFKISNQIRDHLEEKLAGYNINLISPVGIIDWEIINKNADEILMNKGEDYDKIIVYALEGRDKSKFKEKFGEKVEIRYKK
jgi:acetylglutamate kinase